MDREPDSRHSGVWLAVFAMAGLLAYPLSLGPVLWLEINVDVPEWLTEGFALLYAPLNFAHENGPDWLVEAFDWYLELWDVYYVAAW